MPRAHGDALPERQLVNLFIRRFPLSLVLATKHEHFETWVQARRFLENAYRAGERTLQDYYHDTPKEEQVLACQHPDVVALGLAGAKGKRIISRRNTHWLTARYLV